MRANNRLVYKGRVVRALAASLLLHAMALTAQAQDQIPWADDFQRAVETASAQNRLVWLHFWADDCAPCRNLDRVVFNRPDVAQAVANSYVPVKVNVKERPDLARHYGINRWPTDVVVDSTGKEMFRNVSPQDPFKYIAMLDQVASRSRGPVEQPWNAVAATAPSAFNRSGTRADEVSYQPYQNDRRSQPFQPQDPTSSQGAYGSYEEYATEPGTPGVAPRRPEVIINREYQPQNAPTWNTGYGPTPPQSGGGSYRQPPPAGGTTWNPGPNSATQPFAGPAPGAYDPRLSMNDPARSPWSDRAQPGPQPPANAGSAWGNYQGAQPPNQSAPSFAPPSNPSPSDNPPIAMDGYCPVTLVDQKKWALADPRWGAIHRGRTYLFVGADEQQRFLANPDLYSPVLSGYDPVKFSEQGQLVDGRRQHGVFFQNQVFLFSDESTLERFWKSPDAFAQAVHQAMQQNALRGKR